MVARLLLKAGADPNGRMGDETALFEAALLGDPPAALLLLDAGARVDERDSIGSTASITAAATDHWRMVLTLLHRGGPDAGQLRRPLFGGAIRAGGTRQSRGGRNPQTCRQPLAAAPAAGGARASGGGPLAACTPLSGGMAVGSDLP